MEIFTDSFLRQPLIALVLAGVLCGYLGVFVVLRRMVFLGAALAEVSSVGIAASMLAGLSPVIGSLGFVVLGIAVFSARPRRQTLPHESVVGVGYVLAAALAVLLVHLGTGEAHMLDILTGNIIGVETADIWWIAGTLAGVIVIHGLFFKEFLFTSFDPETAASQGFHIRLWDALLFLTLGAAVATSIRLVGTLVAFAYLVIPGVWALAVCRSMRSTVVLAPLFAVVPAVLGYYLSFRLDLPTGAAVASVLVFLLSLSLLLKWTASLIMGRQIGP